MLRDVTEDDLPVLFEHQQDPEAVKMAAFPPRDRDGFMTHWRTCVLADAASRAQAVVIRERVAGYVVSWEDAGRRLVGYWIGREYWGRGVATRAVGEFLAIEPVRPVYAWVAERNVASVRVLEKCGFERCAEEPSPRTGDDGVLEVLMRFDGTPCLYNAPLQGV